MIEVEKLIEVTVVLPDLPPSRPQWIATYYFRGDNGKAYEHTGSATHESPEHCYQIAVRNTTIPDSIRVCEIPARQP